MAGVTANGFEKKTFQEIKAEINASMVAALGSSLDVSLDTPQGQIVSIISDAQATMWELMQDVHASFDIRQAQGRRLDQLGGLRGADRKADESDASYRARLLDQRNATASAVDALETAVSLVADVSSVEVQYNASGLASGNGQQALTAQVIVEGGDDIAIAETISNNLVFGLALSGNTSITVDIGNSLCRSILFVRPVLVPVTIDVSTSTTASTGTCGGTSRENVIALITEAFENTYTGTGQAVQYDFLRAVLVAQGIGVRLLTIDGVAADREISAYSRATIDEINVTIGV